MIASCFCADAAPDCAWIGGVLTGTSGVFMVVCFIIIPVSKTNLELRKTLMNVHALHSVSGNFAKTEHNNGITSTRPRPGLLVPVLRAIPRIVDHHGRDATGS
jgi:hypothetical protein